MNDIRESKNFRVLVLLATYNGAQWLPEQLQSIYHQSGTSIKIIARDDASTDQTRAILTSQILAEKPLSVLEDGERLGSAAANYFRLIDSVVDFDFDFISLCDQDDIWESNKLYEACLKLSESNSEGYSCAVRAFWANGKSRMMTQSAAFREADYLFEGAGQGCTFVLSRSSFIQIQKSLRELRPLLPQIHYHDWAIYALVRSTGGSWFIDFRSYIGYRQHSSNDTGAKSSIRGILGRLKKIKAGWYGAQVRAICGLVLANGPDNDSCRTWQLLDEQPGSQLMKRVRRAHFCACYGRRKLSDRAILTAAALVGWMD